VFTVQLLVNNAGHDYSSRAVHVVDRALRTWRPTLFMVYMFSITVALIVLLVIVWSAHRKRSAADMDSDFSRTARNANFAFAGLVFALCTGLVSDTSSMSLTVSAIAFAAGVFTASVGGAYWFAAEMQDSANRRS
jgi:L-lactate permease